MLTFFNEHHPQPARIDLIAAELARRGLDRIVTPHSVSLSSLERIHTPRYLHFLRSAWREWLTLDPRNAEHDVPPSAWPVSGMRRDIEPDHLAARLGLYGFDNDTRLTAATWNAAKTGAACAVNAAHALRLGERASFALTHPSGHHAGADYCGGGSVLNNAALAAQHLLDDGMGRVAILDLNAHHGNGTQDIFYQRADVLCISIHADPRSSYPFYLGHGDETGAGAGAGYNMNLPLARATTAVQWFAALETACLKMASFAPQALVVALGIPTQFGVTAEDCLRIGERLAYVGLPTVFVCEGGAAAPGAESAQAMANTLDAFETAA